MAYLMMVIIVLVVLLIKFIGDSREYCDIIQSQEEQIEQYEKLIFEKEGEI